MSLQKILIQFPKILSQFHLLVSPHFSLIIHLNLFSKLFTYFIIICSKLRNYLISFLIDSSNIILNNISSLFHMHDNALIVSFNTSSLHAYHIIRFNCITTYTVKVNYHLMYKIPNYFYFYFSFNFSFSFYFFIFLFLIFIVRTMIKFLQQSIHQQ